MGGYIGSSVGNLANAAERKQTYSITTSTTSLTGLKYTPTKVHVFHNGVRLVDGTDYTATNGTSITLTNAAQNGDEVVVISYPSFQVSDTVSAANGGTFAGNVTFSGTTTGLDLNGTDLILDADGDSKIVSSTDDTISVHTSGSERFKIDGDGIITMPNQPAFLAQSASTVTMSNIGGSTNTDIAFGNERFDQNADYDTSTSVFTAPVTGKYFFSFQMRIDNIDSATTSYSFYIQTSNRTVSYIFDPDTGADRLYYTVAFSLLTDMDANDTAHIEYYINAGAAQAQVVSGANFFGYLVA